jgi:hypothetical protein
LQNGFLVMAEDLLREPDVVLDNKISLLSLLEWNELF